MSFRYDHTVKVMSRFKGLDLLDRVPEELCMEVRDIVQEAGIKTITGYSDIFYNSEKA